jgi:4,5-dihydroxyphthalate decarboxylase
VTALALSIAIGDYDRARPLFDEEVHIDGVRPIFLKLEPEEIFFRAFRQEAFDVCELSLSTFALHVARGDNTYVGIPVFPSRAFRHTAIYIRTDRNISRPEDLRGRRIGIPEYQLTATIWARAILEDDYGVKPSQILWVRGGQERPGRVEKSALTLPPEVRIEDAPPDATLSGMLERGDIDGLVAPRAPSCFERGAPNVGWLFPDPTAAATDWYRRTRLFPIMHLLGVRRELVLAHPWLPLALLKAFEQAKALAIRRLGNPAAPKVSLPFLDETVRAVQALMGEDYWPYGLEPNRVVLQAFLDAHHRQGLSQRRVAPEELFHESFAETYRI